MDRVGKDYVKNILSGKTVAVVCSGPSCLENTQQFIDSHDVVVRVNNYKMRGFNKSGSFYDFSSKVGKRTDVHYSFYGNSIRKSAKELREDGVKLCMCKCPDSKPISCKWHEDNNKQNGIDFRWIYKNREDFFPCPVFIPDDKMFLDSFNLLGNHIPTTGFAAIIDILSFNPKSLYFTGIDGFASGRHNVNEIWRPGNPSDPIKHVPGDEVKYLKQLVKEGRITADKRFMEAQRI